MPDSLEPEWPKLSVSGPTLSFLPQEPPNPLWNEEPQVENSNGHCTGGPEFTVIEQIVALKKELRMLDLESFWCKLMEHIAALCDAQYAFVARRVRDDEAAQEIGGHKPLLFGTTFYFNDGFQDVGIYRHRYFAGGNPLSHMDLKKPCLIPENLSSYISFDQDKLPFSAEGYLAIPLFSGQECLAYLGLMWSDLGLQNRKLSWSFMKTVLFSLEDIVVQRIQEDNYNADQYSSSPDAASYYEEVLDGMPRSLHGPQFSSQHLKPFARSLSHELRTPMQGVVGMLDVMHATVREALGGKPSPKTAYVFQSLKESIEMVQDSARRAVEAADNVVHAYDLNMEVPKTPQMEREISFPGGAKSPIATTDSRPNLFIEGSNITVNPYKRRRSNPPETMNGTISRQQKVRRVSSPKDVSPRTEEVKIAVLESDKIFNSDTPAHQLEAVMATMVDSRPSLAVRRSAPHLLLEGINVNLQGPALRFTKLRDLVRLVVNESLHVGGRPDFVVSDTTELGEKIVVRSRSSNGEVYSKTIHWSVDPTVPDALLADDRDLAKLISCVFLNAVKFTNNGLIKVYATLGKANDILINVKDTGPGIPMAFLPNLFKPFAREDASITRSKDGLGLGLLVAKGLARKMGGDLVCVRSSTSGADRGSEFEIRLPVNQHEAMSSLASSAQLITPPNMRDPSMNGSASNGSRESSVLSPLLPAAPTPMQEPTPTLTDESSRTPTPARPLPSPLPTRGFTNGQNHDSKLGEKYPLTFLVAEDNKINRRVLVHMLKRLGYQEIYEAGNGKEAVRTMQNILEAQATENRTTHQEKTLDRTNDFLVPEPRTRQKKTKPVDVILMDLWMPEMDGYEATSKILQMINDHSPLQTTSPLRPNTPPSQPPTVLAVSADVTDEALSRASKVGMKGFMTKPYRLIDLERLIAGFCSDTAQQQQVNDSMNA
ncbi:hypothetical protein BJX70DRAFT_356167 [Aspergillus crustosus]